MGQRGSSRVPSKWKDRLLLRALPIALPVVASVAGALAAANVSGWAKFYWYTLAGLSIFGSGTLTVIKDRQTKSVRDQAVRAKTALAMALSGAGQPLIAALSSAAAAYELEKVRAAVKVLMNRAVAVAQAECGRQTGVECLTRAVFYKFAGEDLELEYCEGRHGDTPRQRFSANGTPHEVEAIRVARGSNSLVVKDLENAPPPNFTDPKGRSYKTFIAVPVRVENRSFGMLVVDSDQPFTLSEVDKGYLVMLAGMLAAGLVHLANTERRESTGGDGNGQGPGGRENTLPAPVSAPLQRGGDPTGSMPPSTA